jgi:hypothetical protein
MAVKRLLVVAALTVAGTAASAGSAGACSCADEDPRDRLERGERALVGRVLSVRPGDFGPPARFPRYVVRVEHDLNVRLGRKVVVLGDDISSCSFDWKVGQRVGAFIRRTRGGWFTQLCSLARPAELERAATPYPRPLGSGRPALLAGGSFGDARLMALDERGRVLGYGFGEGSVRRISVCPGSRVAAELVDRGRPRTFVVLRSLETLEVLSSTAVPHWTDEVACADASGTTVYAGGILYRGRPVVGRADVFRISGSARTTIVSRAAEQFGLSADAAYVWSGRRVLAIPHAGGGERALLRMGLAESIVPSPFGGRVAVWGFDGRLRLVDLASGAVESRRLGYLWALEWLAPDRLLVRVAGTGVLLDGELNRQRRFGFYRVVGQAHVGDGVFGMDRYRLVRMDLDSGRRDRLAALPDRGIDALVGVPDPPELTVPRRAPRASGGAARAALKLCRWTATRNPPSSSISTAR